MFGIMSGRAVAEGHAGNTERQNPVVVKLGGSLAPYLPELIPVLRASSRPLLVVPGGGQFANAIRDSAAAGNPDAAHWMAIAAMEQYGWLVASLGIPETDLLSIPEQTRVLLPYHTLREHDPLLHSWDVTSDTIAAWVAGILKCDLLILKSVDGITVEGTLAAELHSPVVTGIVDPCFLPYVLGHGIRTFVVNGTDPDRVGQWLVGRSVPGTGIGTTF